MASNRHTVRRLYGEGLNCNHDGDNDSQTAPSGRSASSASTHMVVRYCNGVGGRKSLGSVPSIHQHGSLPHESHRQ